MAAEWLDVYRCYNQLESG
ncbi:hypothetical protein CGLO_18119 [Colletotrichum gloeosporioides Cg-14]|uniref:Uncharacterized protein n=1 Tax=Colletotrichum gloeosporioides (strain Cg-14) TaxID=1237896 RepID=T0JV35_COLGC|nr:hypothetical protein CGLO_18119 [Colletotrichum gloeosporioides Cg-14]